MMHDRLHFGTRIIHGAMDEPLRVRLATGGIDRNARIFPVMKVVARDGIRTVATEKTAELFKRSVA